MNRTDEININVENKKSQKKKIALILIAVILLIGVTYAYFKIRKVTNEFTGNIGGFKITYESSNEIKVDKAYPIRDYEVEDLAYTNKFKIANNGDKPIYVKLAISDISISDEFKDNHNDLKWALYEETVSNDVTTTTKVSNGTFETSENKDIIILPEVTLNAATTTTTVTKNYILRAWINETYQNQNAYERGTLSGKITAIVQGKSGNYIASKIPTSNSNSPVFTKGSNNNGIFVLKDDTIQTNFGFPLYYYRGPLTNTGNYVQFGTYKKDIKNIVFEESTTTVEGEDTPTTTYTSSSKTVANAGSPIIWRILKINEDKSVTLIAENNIGENIAWSSNGNSVDYKDSAVKVALEKWYEETFTESYLDSKVMVTEFCNDKSYNYGAATSRLNRTTASPTLECADSDIVKSKVGLLTADELVYAGAIYNEALTNKTYTTYLNNKTSFWTMTPFDSTNIFMWKADGLYISNNTSNTNNVAAARPVITIQPDVTVVSGDGKQATPYILSVE